MDETIPLKKEEKKESDKTTSNKVSDDSGLISELPENEFISLHRILPIKIPMTGRTLKLRDVFTLSGAVNANSTVVTVTAAGSSGAQTDLKSFMLFKDEWHVGMTIRITARGVITDDGTRVCKFSIGSGLAASHTEWNSMTSTAATVTDSPWHLEWIGIVTTIGSSGTLEAQMTGDINRVNKDDPNTATVAINTTGSVTIALTADWDGTDAGNSISIRQWIIEVLY